MKVIACAACMAVVALLSGCVSLKVETETGPSCLKLEGLANGYATLSALHPYNGTILDFGLLSETGRRGEILSLDLWPLAGVGVGVVGARVRLLPLEVGLGALWYNPKAEAAHPRGSGKVEGSGNIARENRPVGDFSRISLRGGGELNITQGDRESLTIEADDNILPLIETEVSNGTLSIGPKDRRELHPIQPVRIALAVKELEGLTLSGAAAVKAPGLAGDKLEITVNGPGKIAMDALAINALTVRINGSGDCNLAGRADTQTIHISGSGKYRAGKLEGRSVTVAISGSSDAVVSAAETLDVRINGSGRVEYYGQPRVSEEVRGSGRVISLGQPQ